MERYKDRKIPIGKFELSNYYANSQVFPLIDEWLHIALQNGIKDLVVKCPLYPLPIFTILGAKSLRELVLVGCTLLPDSLYSGAVSCNSLRKIYISSVRFDENVFQTLLNSCPLIVSVILGYCSGLEKIKSDSLKFLKIQYCGDIWEIDAPNLASLEYTCWYQIPQLKIVRESRQLKHSKFFLHCLGHINAAWSCKLRKFLSNLTSWSEIFIDFRNCIANNLNDLQLDLRASTPHVDILNVKNWESPYFLDALLWSCHPRRLNLQSSIETIAWFINRLIYMKNWSHSTSHISKPGHSQLKEVKAFDGKNQLLQLGSGELAVRILTKGEKKGRRFQNKGEFRKTDLNFSRSEVRLKSQSYISTRDLHQHHRVPIPQVDVLDVEIEPYSNCINFMDALLWSCHPRRLYLRSSCIERIRCFIRPLMYTKNSILSSRQGSDPWHRQLKEVKAHQALELRSGELSLELASGELSINRRLKWQKKALAQSVNRNKTF
ncbi:hypothetical protein BC332_06497 [Capsicum chinense]|nr:hypothetical protein BC332_06497 [Capsicum chinense]